jgi:peptide/nickel transport system substrate-binding protein
MIRNIALALSATFLLQTAGAQEAEALPTNKQLTIGITQEFENLNPIIFSMSASSYIYYMASHPLVAIDTDWKWQCWLCTTLPTLENGLAKIVDEKGTKKLQVSWELKPNAVWGDGTPVTAQDVKLSWEIGLSGNVSTPSKDIYQRIESISIDPKDPKKFTMVFKEIRYDYFQLGTLYIVPSHIEGPIFAKTKNQQGAYEKQTSYNTNPTNPALYNGPYVVKEIKLGSHVILDRNPKYYGPKPAIDRIVMKLIPNTQTLESNLMSGTIDMISELGMSFDQALAFEKRVAKDKSMQSKYSVQYVDGMIYEHIDFNLRNPDLADKRVRQALLHAVDRDKLCAALFENRQKKALTMIHPRDVYYTESVTKYDYSPEKATKLLEEAGWKKGGSGFLEKDGKKLSLTIMTTSQNKTRELVEVFLQEQWKKIGIELTINNEPARVFFGETVKKAAYPGLAMYAWVSSPDNPPRSTLHSKEIPTKENGWNGQNSGGWANKRVDQLLEDIFKEFDVQKRKAMMEEVQKLYTEEVPVMPLYMRADVAVVPANLKGFKMPGHQFHSTLNIDQWTLDGSGQGH